MVGEIGDEILVPSPIYPPLSAPGNQGRRCIRLPHQRDGDSWRMNIETWEENGHAQDEGHAFFCHPHNPLGRWWSDAELAEVVDFCQRHNLMLISDEIHCQLLLEECPGGFKSTALINDWPAPIR